MTKKAYLTEEEMVELIALNSVLPGPTSTQTIVSIGYKTGGPGLAFFDHARLGPSGSLHDDRVVFSIPDP